MWWVDTNLFFNIIHSLAQTCWSTVWNFIITYVAPVVAPPTTPKKWLKNYSYFFFAITIPKLLTCFMQLITQTDKITSYGDLVFCFWRLWSLTEEHSIYFWLKSKYSDLQTKMRPLKDVLTNLDCMQRKCWANFNQIKENEITGLIGSGLPIP